MMNENQTKDTQSTGAAVQQYEHFNLTALKTPELNREQTPIEETIPQFGSLEKLQGVAPHEKIFEFLNAFKCNSPIFPNDFGAVIKIYSNQTIGEAFKRMTQYRLMSIPVVDPQLGKPLYVLSMMHIIEYLLDTYRQEEFEDTLWNKIRSYFSTTKADAFMNIPLNQLEMSGIHYDLDPAHIIREDATIADALNLMVDTKSHRVLVVNSAGEMVNVITQSRIIQLVSNMVDCSPKFDKSVKELGLGMRNVVCVLDTQTAYDAFKVMRERRISGVAVVDSKGVLIGNISASDIKLIGYSNIYWSLLGKPVRDYLTVLRSKPDTKIRSSVFALLEDTSKYPIVVRCRPHHSLGFVIRMVSYYKVHRLFLVDDTGSPVGIITLTDILEELVK